MFKSKTPKQLAKFVMKKHSMGAWIQEVNFHNNDVVGADKLRGELGKLGINDFRVTLGPKCIVVSIALPVTHTTLADIADMYQRVYGNTYTGTDALNIGLQLVALSLIKENSDE